MKVGPKSMVQVVTVLLLVALTVFIGFFLFATYWDPNSPIASAPVLQISSTPNPTGTSVVATVAPRPTGVLLPTATRTPLPIPTLPPTPTSRPRPPTLTPAPPTPVKPITSWLTYTNSTFGYRVSYPNTWYLEESDSSNVFITSYLPPYFRGTGAVKIDLLVSSQQISTTLALSQAFCIDGQCGSRVDENGPFTEPIRQGLNHVVTVQIPKAGQYFWLSAVIQDPPDAAKRNTAIVEQIIASYHFVR
jgi:hypothetical protein